MESITYLKNIKIAPKKLRFYAPTIKKMTPGEALKVLLYMHEKPGRFFYQAIKSAVANAKNTLKVQDDLLQFKALVIEEGQKLKRFHPGSRGSAKPYKKRFSHIKIILTASTPAVPVEKTVEKKETKKVKPKTAPKKKELKVSAKKS